MDRVPGFDSLGIMHQSDWIRTEHIAHYGGVWLDPTIVMFEPVESWLVEGELCGFAGLHDVDVIENWAFSAPPGSALMQAWRVEFARAIAMGFDAYKRSGPVVARMGGTRFHAEQLPYLTHQAALVMAASGSAGALRFAKASGGHNPLQYLVDARYNGSLAVHTLLHTRCNPGYRMIKLARNERNRLTRALKAGRFVDGGFVSEALLCERVDSDWMLALTCVLLGVVIVSMGIWGHEWHTAHR